MPGCAGFCGNWRDVRVAEGARLESVYRVSLSGVRIPLSPLDVMHRLAVFQGNTGECG